MTRLRWTTAGESHGPCLVGILEGMPSGFPLDLERVDSELARRQAGYGRGGRMAIETDRIEVLGGMRGGETLGSPLAFRIANRDARLESMPDLDAPRPGHGDLTGCQKHGHRSPRAILERASARETAARVAAAGLARQVLEHFGGEVFGHVVSLGGVELEACEAWELGRAERAARRGASEFQSLDTAREGELKAVVDRAAQAGDTLGGRFEVRALGLPPGLGGYEDPAQRLTARLGGAVLSIPAIKGIEFGTGWASADLPGSEVHDEIVLRGEGDSRASGGRFGRRTNRSGGLEGGMTTGEPLVLLAAMKPISTLRAGLASVDFASGEAVKAPYERSDTTAVPAASVVGEALVALVLTSALLEKLGGNSLGELERSFAALLAGLAEV
ncbi:MAG TPA: chorismate synthase [Planctomycetota bacterium]|nr:chorismate synthase [Planctomycetota bacterium]